MKRLVYILVLAGAIALGSVRAHAFTDHGFYGGVGLFFENSFWRQTQSSTGEKSMIGTPSIPLMVKYDWNFYGGFFVSPTLAYTPLGRDSAGGSATTTVLHLIFPFGQNFTGDKFDWYVGPGILRRSIKGNGGTEILSNGASSSMFARPNRSSVSTTYTLGFGGSYNWNSSRYAVDVTGEGLFSEKRTFSFMLSYSYMFSGGSL